MTEVSSWLLSFLAINFLWRKFSPLLEESLRKRDALKKKKIRPQI
jgi:hypothetical protein